MKLHPELNMNRNHLISGENQLVMEKLLAQGYSAKFEMIYFDGPFNSGLIFSNTDRDLQVDFVNPWSELSSIQNFLDKDKYLKEYKKRMTLAKNLLSDSGVFVLQTNLLEGHNVRVLLDQVFGRDHFLCEVIWKNSDIPLARPGTDSHYGCQHETLYFYSKTENYSRYSDYVYPSIWDDVSGYCNLGNENTNYPSQKPEKLLERVLEMTSSKGSLVGDFYCGSGTFAMVAEKMDRKWIACDSSSYATVVTKNRLKRAGVRFEFHTLVDEFNPHFLSGNVYKKEMHLPFSLDEFNQLKEATARLSKVDVYAYSYASEVDLAVDFKKYTLHLIVPLITSKGISEQEQTSIPKPTLVKTDNGYQLNIQNHFEWVLYNIVHVERDSLGCIKVNKDLNGDNYVFNLSKTTDYVNHVIKKVNNNWIKRIKSDSGRLVFTDIFEHTYIAPDYSQFLSEGIE